jgi:uncharacterized protein (TIGR04255 family)
VYRNPPILEAIVTFVFRPSEPWNLTIPGRLYEKVREDYPEPPGQQDVIEAGLGLTSDLHSSAPASVTLSHKASRTVFRNQNRLLLLGPNTLGVNCAEPYEGWESLFARSTKALEAYCDAADPSGIERVGLRYINRITIPKDRFRLEDYFHITQQLPPEFGDQLNAFVDRAKLSWADIPAEMTFTWGSADDAESRGSVFILDFDLSWTQDASFAEGLERIQELRRRERLAFESVIRDELRSMFDAD